MLHVPHQALLFKWAELLGKFIVLFKVSADF